MGLKIPNLDKKDYDTRLQEAIAKLPSYSKNWTEYNASDPGITIVELLAWLSDINSYKLNRIRKEHEEALLKLFVGIHKNSVLDEDEENEDEIDSFAKLEKNLFSTYKAVTLTDYETLVLENEDVKRVKASANKDKNIVSIIVVPNSKEDEPKPSNELISTIKEHLNPRLLLTTKIELKSPNYLEVNTNIKIQTKYQDPASLENLIISKLKVFLHPVNGGKKNLGWKFGEDVHISDIYLLLNDIEGIDIVDSIFFNQNQTSFDLDENSLPISGKHIVKVLSIPSNRSCQNE